MFKWKVSRLGGSKKERNKQKLNNESSDQINSGEDIYAKNNNVINKERSVTICFFVTSDLTSALKGLKIKVSFYIYLVLVE